MNSQPLSWPDLSVSCALQGHLEPAYSLLKALGQRGGPICVELGVTYGKLKSHLFQGSLVVTTYA